MEEAKRRQAITSKRFGIIMALIQNRSGFRCQAHLSSGKEVQSMASKRSGGSPQSRGEIPWIARLGASQRTEKSRRVLGGVNQRPAAPAGEPFPTWLDEIRSAVVPANVGHALRARRGFSLGRRVLFDTGAAWRLRFPSRFFAGHILLPRLASPPLGVIEIRPGSAGH